MPLRPVDDEFVDEKARQYLARTSLLPLLERGLEDFLRVANSKSERSRSLATTNPINFLASWLLRHNPRHSPADAEQMAGWEPKEIPPEVPISELTMSLMGEEAAAAAGGGGAAVKALRRE